MRWVPRNEAELRDALEKGLLVESHYMDLKRMPAPGRAGNKSLAVDLASLAVDGGTLLYGVDEKTKKLTPFPLNGFRERVDQVGRSLVDEPLRVRVIELPSEEGSISGYAVVVVPESPRAPHMVEGRYRGRGDTTNVVLSDAEVVRLHGLRRESRRAIVELLREEIRRDPSPPEHRKQAHMFVLAEPLSSRRQMLLNEIGDENPTKWMLERVLHPAGMPLKDQWSPDLGIVSTVSRAAEGWSAHGGFIAPGRQVRPGADEDDYFEIEFRENGGVRLFCSRASVPHPRSDGERVAFETLIGGLTYRVVLIARFLSTICGHHGGWEMGLAVTNLKGAVSWKMMESWGGYAVPFSSEEYVEVAEVTTDEIADDPQRVTGALFGRLNRALNNGSVPLPEPAR